MPDQVQPRGYAAEGPTDTHHRTVLVSAFEGWNDAAQAATGALRHLLKALEIASYEVDRIRSSSFFDYRSTRPVICCVDGRRQIPASCLCSRRIPTMQPTQKTHTAAR